MVVRPRRILVVEDDKVIRSTLVDVLELEGYEARSAGDGEQALGVLADWKPDLIVLDLMMPRMDGRQFRVEQQKRPALADIPVIVLSAGRDLAGQTADLAPAGILAKPFDLDDFLQVIQRHTSAPSDPRIG